MKFRFMGCPTLTGLTPLKATIAVELELKDCRLGKDDRVGKDRRDHLQSRHLHTKTPRIAERFERISHSPLRIVTLESVGMAIYCAHPV